MRLPKQRNRKHLGNWAAAGVLWLVLLTAMPPAMAIQYGSGTYGRCQYGSCGITISTNSTVNVNVTPAPGGACSVQSDSVSVLTSNSAGFSLTLANSSTNPALVHGGSSINASAATQASPAALATNTWGYRVDGVGGFGAGPTTAQSSAAPGGTLFAGVPASNATASTIANTNSAANPAVITTVWYGVCANTSLPNGIYTTQVTYTAVAN